MPTKWGASPPVQRSLLPSPTATTLLSDNKEPLVRKAGWPAGGPCVPAPPFGHFADAPRTESTRGNALGQKIECWHLGVEGSGGGGEAGPEAPLPGTPALENAAPLPLRCGTRWVLTKG